MKRIISFKTAANGNLILFGIFIIFHLLVIAGVIPMDIVWGGRIDTRDELIKFEIVSLIILLVCAMLTLLKANYIKISKLRIFANIGMWVLFVLFLLNTIGNIFAITWLEKLFAIITALLSFFSLRLALEKDTGKNGSSKY